MSDTQLAAQHLAQALARMRLAERDAGRAIARITVVLARVQTRKVVAR